MVLDLIRDQGGFREVRNEYGSRIGGNEGLDVSIITCYEVYLFEGLKDANILLLSMLLLQCVEIYNNHCASGIPLIYLLSSS